MKIEKLETNRNLLAFSGGVDSTSLFFILIENGIPFDIAIVDYGTRAQSKEEVDYAFYLAKKYNKKCYLREYNQINFTEKNGRDFRYAFFDQLIEQYKYETLITAHQLNDKLEWFLMQLSKGAGVYELIGLETYTKRKNYIVYRPLLEYSKDELENFLLKNNYQYFIDSSNDDHKYKRNYIRDKYADSFIKEYKDGVKRSFKYLQENINSLEKQYKKIQFKELIIGQFLVDDSNLKIGFIDRELKKQGVLLSKKTRDEIDLKKECVIAHKIAVSIIGNIVFISPYSDHIMDKNFKEWCRLKKIPKHHRAYLSSVNFNRLQEFFKKL